jgi:hypothetical protein
MAARVTRIVLNRAARLVCELAEIHLERVGRSAEHVDIGARTKDARLQTGDDDDLHFRVLKPKALDRVREFNIDAQVVRVQLEFVTLDQGRVLLNIHR